VLFEAAERFNQRERRMATGVAFIASAILASGALALGWNWLAELRVDPARHAYGAAVWTLLGYTALHLAMATVMAIWCLTRLALGMIDAWRCLTIRICLLWWRFTTVAALLALLLVSGFPHVVS
jgi:cytochrome c oxidase subunit I+III